MSVDPTPAQWVKSSYSQQGGNCVEWAPAAVSTLGVVPVRDSKRADGPVLTVTPQAFTGLVALALAADL
ncbi:DUF397 domain-containing protein [Streptomyces clavuligerus]|uniref:DUF397 domain-containing protein n=1 Tax=Streptomyces clavuligerus TaxID=1901 RepID=B5GWA4_STRCL|nr:DUF397 domain-containing protein [Streptomyces clavuligerus]ANW17674.1 DUF397 domain-containing protein [Streptomyces clavuligerus]AXU12224.1 DUF397 domain-containing protein [Streptomyces clavuligerus]EDY50600.1 hypothetical protein SSCG_03413 [Streptomyces clavuligerus]EFG09803.1 DUF397 domain-containing protein [Streptomyces clavuligerus]MBY6302094.1 DUF397 domain-containing protein [Streptomyces clavuligerus]